MSSITVHPSPIRSLAYVAYETRRLADWDEFLEMARQTMEEVRGVVFG